MKLRLPVLLALTAVTVGAETATEAAIKLFEARKYPEARAALTALVAADPTNAQACYFLGLATRRRGDGRALADALPWLDQAVALAPRNPDYLADCGGTCLELADQRHSFSLATRGRDTMEAALRLDPPNLDGRFGLMRFYAQAPWPLGSTAKAFAQAAEISRQNHPRGLKAWLWLGNYFVTDGDRPSARQACAQALRLDPKSEPAQKLLTRLK